MRQNREKLFIKPIYAVPSLSKTSRALLYSKTSLHTSAGTAASVKS